MSSGRLSGKLALITGASRGIGAGVAKRFAAEGADLVLVARDLKRLERVDDEISKLGVKVTLVPFDLMELEKIDEMGYAIAERFGKLDILIGNAGVLGTLGPITHMDPIVWNEVMTVNVAANWRLIRVFDALLKKSPAGRAIFVTSGITKGLSPYWGAYATSKAALEMMVKVYAAELQNTNPNFRVNLIDPGIVRTDMRAAAMPGEDPATLPAPEQITGAFLDLAASDCKRHGEIIRAQAT